MTPIALTLAAILLTCGGLLVAVTKDAYISLIGAIVATLGGISAITLLIYTIITGVTI